MLNSTPQKPCTVSVALRQRLAECYERGTRLLAHDNDYDYAHLMFAECVQNDPSNLPYVEAMLRNLRAKFPQRRRKRAFGLGSGVDRAMKKATDQRNWKQVLSAGINQLKINPWNAAVLQQMAAACAELRFHEVELAYLKQALDADPKNIDVNRQCARSLARLGQFDQAISCWHRVETNKKGDKEAERMIAQLYEEKLKYPGGKPPNRRAHAARDEHESTETQAVQAQPKLTLSRRQALEKAIRENPTELSYYLELAEVMTDARQYEQAEALLNRALAALGQQAAIHELMDQIRARKVQDEREAANARRSTDTRNQRRQFRMPWLEVGAMLAIVTLIFQLSPVATSAAWLILDVRNWPRPAWFLVNAFILSLLLFWRFWPQLLSHWGRKPER